MASPTIAAPPPWRGSAALSSSNAYETPTSSADEYSSLEPYSFYDTVYPVPSISPSTPHPQYSAIVTVRTTTWVLSRSTTITSIILETYYSTLTDIESSAEAGTVTETTTECTTASGYASVYASGCSSSSTSSSSSSSSSMSLVTMTWSPEVTAYPLPSSSSDEGRSPASTSATSSGSTTTTTTTTTATSGNETPPVVTGGAGSAPQAAKLRTFGVVAALLAILL
ncbi:hypothetical protein ACHAPV_005069 [Trichoderma viride]